MAWIRLAAAVGAFIVLGVAGSANGQEQAPAGASQSFVPVLVQQAEAVRPLVESDLARGFLSKAAELTDIDPRTLLRDSKTREAFTPEEAEKLPQERRDALVERHYDTRVYYTTGYGSPMIYARPLDVLAKHGVESLDGKKVMDFGYGMIGQERMMALMGAEAHGVDVDPFLAKLYSWPGDTGAVEGGGSVTLHHGLWPADEAIAREVGGGYDVIMSKNTLKLGYIHPARKADPRMLVDLGVSDEAFVRAVHDALKPGGLFLVYNISPKQNPPDKPYLPHADGLFPFEREMVEKAGFEVLAWDEADDEAIVKIFAAIGYGQGKSEAELKEELFTRYTVLRRRR